jgi:hypothetical protein
MNSRLRAVALLAVPFAGLALWVRDRAFDPTASLREPALRDWTEAAVYSVSRSVDGCSLNRSWCRRCRPLPGSAQNRRGRPRHARRPPSSFGNGRWQARTATTTSIFGPLGGC